MIIANCTLRSLQGSGSGYTMNLKHNTRTISLISSAPL